MPSPLTLTPIDLVTNHRTDPLGIDDPSPHFAWALTGGARGARQTAWQVRVGTSVGEADAWDSGRVPGDAQLDIAYAGAPLSSRTRYHWQVRVWDETDAVGPWSRSASFETAFLDAADFAGSWLGARPQTDDERHPLAAARWMRLETDTELVCYRVRFEIPATSRVMRGRLHLFADGPDDTWTCGTRKYLSINGVQPDSATHLPRQSIMTYELGAWLRPGGNHVVVKTWRHADSACLALLDVELDDGTHVRVPSGHPAWQARAQPKAGHWDTWDRDGPEWREPTVLGPFGAGPWSGEDRRNRADRLLPALVLRRRIEITRPLARARIYATACGVYELAIDRRPVGDHVLAPGWTDYRIRLHYQTEDATSLLPPGSHELVATVADGWWSGHLAHPPFGASFYGFEKALKLALHLVYTDGTSETVATDSANWQAGTGPVRMADLMEGQITDLACAHGDWRTPIELPPPAGHLQAQPEQPVRRLLELPAQSIVARGLGRCIVDFGQNVVGVVRLRIRAPRGTRLVVRHAEVLDKKGEVWTENLRSVLAVDEHVASGGDDEFLPAFTFHGFRYAEISGLPGGLAAEQVAAIVYGTDTPDRGALVTDNPLLNRLHANIRWSQRGNFLSVPMDCPQRDERMGWTGDAQVFVRTAIANADCAAFYSKFVDDILDAQHPGGAFPDFAPAFQTPERGKFGYADAGVIIPWWLWRAYGDLRIITKAWDAMRRYLDQRDRTTVDDLNADNSFGDWLSPRTKAPNAVLNPVYHAWTHRLMAEMAAALGRADDVEHHTRRHTAIKAAWRRANLEPDGRCHTSDTQTIYACGIRAGLIEPEEGRLHLRRAVERHGWHLDTGIMSTYCLLPALSQAGLDDVAWRVLLQESNPGWLYMVKNGATTIWERWNGYCPDTGPVNIENMNSYNHFAFGAVGEWLYACIAGIDRAPDDIGFQRLVLRPVPGGHCRLASGGFRSPRGLILSRWEASGDTFTWTVSIPPNCTAEVHVPSRAGARTVRENGSPITLPHLRDTPNHAVFMASAGTYRFASSI